MKKTSFILSVVLLLSVLSLSVCAEASETSVVQQVSSNDGGWEIVIVSIGMFVTISVVGVMFLKTVIKNNNKR